MTPYHFTDEHRQRMSESMRRYHARRVIPNLEARTTARFWSKVAKAGPDECWLWLGSQFKGKYQTQARFSYKRQPLPAARFALWGNAGPGHLVAMHKCDNPLCCNPDHIKAGTQAENMADMKAKGRSARGERSGARMRPERTPRGMDRSHSKLTDDIVREIRRRVAAGERRRLVAFDFGVTRENVDKIIRREIWGHVK